MATEAELAIGLYNQLTSDPETRGPFLKLIKKKFPKAPIPEIDAAAPVLGEVAELRKLVKDLTESIANERTDGKINGKFSKLKSERSYTDEGIQKIQALMVEKSIGDPEAAADHFDRLNYKPETITPQAYSGAKFFQTGDDDFKAWFENPDAMLDQTIGAVLTEAQSRRN